MTTSTTEAPTGHSSPGDDMATLARAVWQSGEVFHVLTYFAPEAKFATDTLGLRGWWMGYFGCRAAPLGAVSAATVTATFFSFAPALVERAVPDVWRYATPEQLLTARLEAVDAAARRILGPDVAEDASIARAAELAGEAARAVTGAEITGRPLGAANAALPTPSAPHLALWQALTTLREHRGDGHIAALVTHQLGPAEANLLAYAAGNTSLQFAKDGRKWSDEQWRAAQEDLISRGWLHPDGDTLTDAGTAAKRQLEADTDRLATGPYRALGADRARELVALLQPVATKVAEAGSIPFPNPVGIPAPR